MNEQFLDAITTHVLDTSLGRPAAGIRVELAKPVGDAWTTIASSTTGGNGRCQGLIAASDIEQGLYRLRFFTAEYFELLGQATLYPYIDLMVGITPNTHFHLPLLLSANGFTTYRGS